MDIKILKQQKLMHMKVVAGELLERIKTDDHLKEVLLNTDKTLSQAIDYLKSEAKKVKEGNVAVMYKDDIMNHIVHFFLDVKVPKNNTPDEVDEVEEDYEDYESEEKEVVKKVEPKKKVKAIVKKEPKKSKEEIIKEKFYGEVDLFDL